MKHEYKVGDRVVMVENLIYRNLVVGDVARIFAVDYRGAVLEKNGERSYARFARFIPFREVPPTFPALPEGVQIGDEVEFWDDDDTPKDRERVVREKLSEVTYSYAKKKFTFYDEEYVDWDHCRAMSKTITRFRSLGFLISDLERRGYERDYNMYSKDNSHFTVSYLIEKAGTRYHNEPNTPANWLEEVPEDRP